MNFKMAMSDSQRYSWNLYLINNVEDIFVFLVLLEFHALIIPICFPAAEMRHGHFWRETTFENNQSSKLQTLIYIIHGWSNKAFYGTVVNRSFQSLQGGSLEIMLTVPLNYYIVEQLKPKKIIFLKNLEY